MRSVEDMAFSGRTSALGEYATTARSEKSDCSLLMLDADENAGRVEKSIASAGRDILLLRSFSFSLLELGDFDIPKLVGAWPPLSAWPCNPRGSVSSHSQTASKVVSAQSQALPVSKRFCAENNRPKDRA